MLHGERVACFPPASDEARRSARERDRRGPRARARAGCPPAAAGASFASSRRVPLPPAGPTTAALRNVPHEDLMPATARTLTLADAAFPRAGTLRDTLLVIGASVATALAAQVAIPVPGSPVPITGQTFAVLLTGMLLGPSRAFLAQALYLAEGALGLPVFAGAAAGAAKLFGPTGGYLFAFPLAA